MINQIIMIWSDALPDGRGFNIGKNHHYSENAWNFVERTFQREHGIPSLYNHDPYSNRAPNAAFRVTDFFRNAENNDHRLDMIELVFSVVFRSDPTFPG